MCTCMRVTSKVPHYNQALSRCERILYAAAGAGAAGFVVCMA